jgi:hypothetical protein
VAEQSSLFDLPPRRHVDAPVAAVRVEAAAAAPQPPREAILPVPAGGWGSLNTGMAKLPPVLPAVGCLECGQAVDAAVPFVAVLTGQVETVVRDGKTYRNSLPALLHAACHPAWWTARCAAALAAVAWVSRTPDGASP